MKLVVFCKVCRRKGKEKNVEKYFHISWGFCKYFTE